MSPWIAGLDGLSAEWAPAVWRASWQGAIAIALVWLVCRTVSRLPARVRCWLWRLVYLKLLISLFWARPVAELAVLPALPPAPAEMEMSVPGPEPAEIEPSTPSAASTTVPLPALPSSVPLASLTVPPAPKPLVLPSALSLLLLAWALGVAWCVLRTGREWALVRRLRRASRAVDDPRILDTSLELCAQLGVRRPPELIRTEAIESPILVGTLRPMILFPDHLLSDAPGGQFGLGAFGRADVDARLG